MMEVLYRFTENRVVKSRDLGVAVDD